MSTPPNAPPIPATLPALIEQLATALVASRLHPPGHPAISRPIGTALELLAAAVGDLGAEGLSLIAVDGALLLQGRTPVPASLPTSRLLEILTRWNAAGLRILGSVGADELATFLRLLMRPDAHADLPALAKAAAQAGCRRIGLVASSSGASRATQAPGRLPGGLDAIRDMVSGAFTAVAAGADMDFAAMSRCAGSILAAIDSAARADGEVLDLALQDQEDPVAVLHAIRVSALTMLAARAMTRDSELVLRLGVAGLLHDVGRMLLPLELMQDDDARDDDADALMLEHPALGAEYLMSHDQVDPLCVAVALGHHRAVTGEGYPHTAHEHPVSRFTQLVRIADVYEALTARRPYRAPLSPVRAYRTLLLQSHGVDAGLVRRFVEANGIHPLGARLALDGGEVAQVVRQSGSPRAPVVRILRPGSSGAPRGALLDLSRQRGTAVRIVGPAAAG